MALSLGPDERFELEVAFAEFDKSNTGMTAARAAPLARTGVPGRDRSRHALVVAMAQLRRDIFPVAGADRSPAPTARSGVLEVAGRRRCDSHASAMSLQQGGGSVRR